MTKWRHVKIGDFGRIVTGKTPPSARPDLFGKTYPFITPSDIDGVNREVITERFISEDGSTAFKNQMIPAGTVCFVCIGATIGKMCVAARRSLTNQQVNSIIVDETAHNPRFVFYLLRQIAPDVKGIAGGAATPIISKSSFCDINIRVPPLSSQRRIASILSAYDDLIENNTRRIAILEEMARRIYEEWFVRFRFPGHEGVRMVESELGLVPEGWEIVSLQDLADDIRDAVNPESINLSTPYVGLEHIPRRSITLAEWGKAADVQSTKLQFRARDILFGKIRPYFHKVSVAPVAGVASSDAIVIRPKNDRIYGLVLAVVSSDAFIAHATQTSNGTKMPRANWGVLQKYPIPIPPDHLRMQFDVMMKNMVAAAGNHALRNRNLRATRDLLLPKLISGELDVTNMPEPETEAA